MDFGWEQASVEVTETSQTNDEGSWKANAKLMTDRIDHDESRLTEEKQECNNC